MTSRRFNGRVSRFRCRMRPNFQLLEGRIAPAVFNVDDLSDDVANINNPLPGTLRYAVEQANSSPNSGGPDTINIIKMGKIPMSAPMEVSDAVDIDPFGASDIQIDLSTMALPGPAFKVCQGLTSDTTPVTFLGLTISGANGFPAIMAMDRDVVIKDTEISGNTNSGPGGGVYFASGGYNTLTILNSTIAGNSSGDDGGGVYIKNKVHVLVSNSTISDNIANGKGGGIAAANWLDNNTFAIANSTVTANSAKGSQGGGIFVPTGGSNLSIISTIVSGNLNPAAPDIGAGIIDLQFSAVGSPNGFALGAVSTGNLPFGANLVLGPLGNNGGETRTHAIGPGSAAIDQGTNPNNLDFDQRGAGFSRTQPQGGATDIGAYERSAIPYAHSKRMDVTSSGGTTFNVVVTYTDDVAINVNTIDVNDLKVTGPNAFSATAKSVSVDFNTNGTPRVATYTFDAPGGAWDPTDIGTYTASLISGQVFDVAPVPNAVPAGSLGDFFVKIPVVFLVDELTDINDGNISVGHLSIREAIALTNGLNVGNAATITFDAKVFSSPLTIPLVPANGGDLKITAPVTIQGPAARLTLSGALASRVFNVDIPGVVGSVVIKDLSMSNGFANTGSGGAVFIQNDSVTFDNCTIQGNTAVQNGGGIGTAAGGSVTLIATTVSGNTASAGGGGGVYLLGSGTLLVQSSTISGNICPNNDGGGIFVFGSSAVSSAVVTSTISGNSGRRGGGIYLGNWLGKLAIFNSTITNNSATVLPDGGGILIGGAGSLVGKLTLSSTILAGNFAATAPDLEFLAPLANQSVPGDNNLVGVADSGNFTLTGAGNLTGTLAAPLNPGLNPLANYGGPTQTQSLQAGSPASNTGNNVLCLQFDQRGLLLNQNLPMSIGSFGTNIISVQPPTVVSALVNGTGASGAQRSMVTSFAITFSNIVTLPANPAAAFILTRIANPASGPESTLPIGAGATINLSASQAGSLVTLTFIPGGTVGVDPGNSLKDGTYQLTILAANVTYLGLQLDGDGNGSAGGNFLTAATGPNRVFRLFGDGNGSGNVDASDFGLFRQAFGTTGNIVFDFDANGSVDVNDFGQFRFRYGTNVP